MGHEAVAMGDVAIGDALGQEQLDRLADELVAAVPERGLDLRIGVGDVGRRVNAHDRVGRRLEHGAEPTRVIGKGGLLVPFRPRALDQRDLLRGREAAACAPRILPGLKGAVARTIGATSGAASRESATQLGYQPALDGIRALAVLAVLLYHGRLGSQLVFRTITAAADHPPAIAPRGAAVPPRMNIRRC